MLSVTKLCCNYWTAWLNTQARNRINLKKNFGVNFSNQIGILLVLLLHVKMMCIACFTVVSCIKTRRVKQYVFLVFISV